MFQFLETSFSFSFSQSDKKSPLDLTFVYFHSSHSNGYVSHDNVTKLREMFTQLNRVTGLQYDQKGRPWKNMEDSSAMWC